MDISDILRDLNGPDLNHDDPFSDNPPLRKNGLHPGQADLQALTRAWVNERGATELLPYARMDVPYSPCHS
jgi:GINS complex subunit 4